MKGLEHLLSERVFHYFEDFCKVPHASYHCSAAADYIEAFASKHHLRCRRDEADNVIIWKEASHGRELDKGIMLQGHLDMVAVKDEGVDFNFDTDGIRLTVNGDWMSAEGTTLGGDDGIAVAMMLAVLEDEALSHPALECLFTTDEEVGLLGATALDTRDLTSQYMLNLDSEEEPIIYIGCSGGARVTLELPLTEFTADTEMTAREIAIKGLIGGHSGFDINRGLASANQLMLEILKDLSAEFQFGVSFLKGGTVANAIPVEAKSTLLIPKGEAKQFDKRMEHLAEQLINRWQKKEPGLQIQWQESPLSEKPDAFILSHDTLHAWESIPCGVIAMNPTLPGFVETSSSLGVITLEDGILRLIANIRSDKEEAKEAMKEQCRTIAKNTGGKIDINGDYPGWPMKENSDFQQLASRVYEEIHGKKPILETIHAGLECGIFSQRMPELDIISTGPDVLDGHTTHERMSISSIDRVYRFVRRILETSGR